MKHRYKPENRVGDHICYISDLTKIRNHFPNWNLSYNLPRIFDEIIERYIAQSSVKRGAANSH